MRTRMVLTGLAAAALTGCVVAPYPGTVYQGPTVAAQAPIYQAPVEAPVVVNVAPPPPVAEVIPVAPFLGAIWIAGFWNWAGGHHVWAPGHWARPMPGRQWQPARWSQAGPGRWQLDGGRWH